MSSAVTTDVEFRRFMQMVRRRVRLEVVETREPPALTCWVSDGGNPRKVAGVRVGRAEDALDVRAQIREVVVRSGARWAAVGRSLYTVHEDDLVPSVTFGLVGCSVFEALRIVTDIRAGEVGAWYEEKFDTSELEPLLQAALRAVDLAVVGEDDQGA